MAGWHTNFPMATARRRCKRLCADVDHVGCPAALRWENVLEELMRSFPVKTNSTQRRLRSSRSAPAVTRISALAEAREVRSPELLQRSGVIVATPSHQSPVRRARRFRGVPHQPAIQSATHRCGKTDSATRPANAIQNRADVKVKGRRNAQGLPGNQYNGVANAGRQ